MAVPAQQILLNRRAKYSAKFETIEERHALGEIDRNIYEKVAGKLRDESKKINDDLDGLENNHRANEVKS